MKTTTARVAAFTDREWVTVNEQCRDKAENDNRTAAEQVRDAQGLRRWADGRANDAAFAAQVERARQMSTEVLQRFKPRAVS